MVSTEHPRYLLTSTESKLLAPPRICRFLRRLRTNSRDDLMLVRIDPPLIGQGITYPPTDIDVLILATRHKGFTLFPVSEWPAYVQVALPMIQSIEEVDFIDECDLRVIAWGELHPDST